MTMKVRGQGLSRIYKSNKWRINLKQLISFLCKVIVSGHKEIHR